MLRLEKIFPTGIITAFSNGSIEYRPVEEDGSVGPAKGLYEDVARRIFKLLNRTAPEYSFAGIIPKNVKYVDNTDSLKIVWTVKAHKRDLEFSDKKNNGSYAIPNLCFKITGTTLSVIAFKRFSEESIAYEAPFTNIQTQTEICMGSAALNFDNITTYEDIIYHAEYKFFCSKFTHEAEDYHKLGKGKEVFDNDWLKPLGSKNNQITIEDFIRESY